MKLNVHKELGTFTGTPDVRKQITMQDLQDKKHQTIDGVTKCIGFRYTAVVDTGTPDKFYQDFYFNRYGMKVWEITSLLGDGEELGDIPIRIRYEIPKEDLDLVKIAAMGLLYVKLTLQERIGFYERINYELLEVTNGI